MTPTCMIVEDERVLREALVERLRRLWPQLVVTTVAADGVEAIEALAEHVPDVVFLDIRMPGGSGFDVARALDGRSHIVFVTAYDAHAVEAFEQDAVDYILKPFDDERLAKAIRRLKRRLAAVPDSVDGLIERLSSLPEPRDYLRWINASQGQAVKVITVDEVCYFQADTKYTRVVCAEGEALIRRSLKELSGQLDPAKFWPIHRSTIVNAGCIASVRRNLAGELVVRLKTRPESLTVSDTHRRLFRQM